MKPKDSDNRHDLKSSGIAILAWMVLVLTSCAGINPHNRDVALTEETPYMNQTPFDEALSNLGLMTLIYGSNDVNIMVDDGSDHTGTSVHTGGEIPSDVIKIMESTLNTIGGTVYFIPTNYNTMYGMQSIGYPVGANKQIPHVILTGAITGFDRGLETRGKNTDFDMETKPFTNAPKWTPGDVVGMEYADAEKTSIARITIDLNLIDFQLNRGIQRMNAVNSIYVRKGAAERELGITIFGPTFGFKGSIKKVQGRHAATRLLIQLGVIQVIGKFFDLPYWNLLPDGQPDPVVLEIVTSDFFGYSDIERALKTQELLYLNGYDVPVTGQFDESTITAIRQFDETFQPDGPGIDLQTYLKLYCHVPITLETLNQRAKFNQGFQEFIEALKRAELEAARERQAREDSGQASDHEPSAPDAASTDKRSDAKPSAVDRIIDLLKSKESGHPSQQRKGTSQSQTPREQTPQEW